VRVRVDGRRNAVGRPPGVDVTYDHNF
jgi:hypothetical protein